MAQQHLVAAAEGDEPGMKEIEIGRREVNPMMSPGFRSRVFAKNVDGGMPTIDTGCLPSALCQATVFVRATDGAIATGWQMRLSMLRWFQSAK